MSEYTQPSYGDTAPATDTNAAPEYGAHPVDLAGTFTNDVPAPQSETDPADLAALTRAETGAPIDTATDTGYNAAPTDGPLSTLPPSQVAPAADDSGPAVAGQTVKEAGVEWTGHNPDAPAPDYALPVQGE